MSFTITLAPSSQFPVFLQAPGTLLLRQIDISIDNIASFGRTRDYRPLRPVAECPRLMVEGIQQRAASGAASELSRLALQSNSSQTHFLEDMYLAMLKQMDGMNSHLRSEEADLKGLRAEVNAIMTKSGHS